MIGEGAGAGPHVDAGYGSTILAFSTSPGASWTRRRIGRQQKVMGILMSFQEIPNENIQKLIERKAEKEPSRSLGRKARHLVKYFRKKTE